MSLTWDNAFTDKDQQSEVYEPRHHPVIKKSNVTTSVTAASQTNAHEHGSHVRSHSHDGGNQPSRAGSLEIENLVKVNHNKVDIILQMEQCKQNKSSKTDSFSECWRSYCFLQISGWNRKMQSYWQYYEQSITNACCNNTKQDSDRCWETEKSYSRTNRNWENLCQGTYYV